MGITGRPTIPGIPRARGRKGQWGDESDATEGDSPRARTEGSGKGGNGAISGGFPARADGSRMQFLQSTVCARIPHARGRKRGLRLLGSLKHADSPRARTGGCVTSSCRVAWRGFPTRADGRSIPACAGEPRLRLRRRTHGRIGTVDLWLLWGIYCDHCATRPPCICTMCAQTLCARMYPT